MPGDAHDVGSGGPTSGNPLWPSGVSAEMVNRYVDAILADPDINMRFVPDSAERVVYASTVRITLNVVYEALSDLHGMELLGHVIELERHGPGHHARAAEILLASGVGAVDLAVLEALADELLRNTAVNQRWIPDVVERQVYTICLRLVFTILDAVADTLAIRLCGHELKLSFQPLTADQARSFAKKSAERARVSVGSCRERLTIDEDALEKLVKQAVDESRHALEASGTVGSSMFAQLPLYTSFLKALHRTLYSLMVGILDELLFESELVILEDRIHVRLVPAGRGGNFLAGTSSASNALAATNEAAVAVAVAKEEEGSSRRLREELEEARSRIDRAEWRASLAALGAALLVIDRVMCRFAHLGG